MRILPSAFTVMFSGLLMGACVFLDAEYDCENNPELACYTGHTGGMGTTTNTGGTGGCTLAEDCPAGTKCQVAACTATGECMLIDKECGGLDCNATTGLCEGCNDSDKPCPTKECYTSTCNSATKACDEDAQTGDPCMSGSCAGGICLKSNGVDCTTADECGSGNCLDGVCCDGPCDGTCNACDVTGSEGTCTPQAVGDTNDPECMTLGGCGATPGYCQCSDGVHNGDETDVDCGGTKCGGCATGYKCKATTDCAADSNRCVDGFCCNAVCDGPCLACDSSEHPGICSSPTAGSLDGLCNAAAEVCGTTGGQCFLDLGKSFSLNSQCATNNCKGATLTCKKCPSGSGGADCSAGDVCIDGSCFAPGPNGKACQANGGCTSGNCVDGVCCDNLCDGTCMACHVNYTGQTSGTCAPILAGHDPHSECDGPDASGACSGALSDANNASACGQF